MLEYFIYYTESNLFCFIIFAIMLTHDLLRVDRQEKQVKYDRALIAFMLYFVSDIVWAAIISGVLPRVRSSVLLINFSNYILMAAMTYMWLEYVRAAENVPHRNQRRSQFIMALPFLAATVALIVTYLIAPQSLLDDQIQLMPLYDVFQITVPIIYIIVVLFFTLRRAFHEENLLEKRRHLYLGLFPMMVVLGGLTQAILLPDTPIFCFACAVLMLIFYIQAMETQISIDPLTRLNNRGQLLRYTSLQSNLLRDNLRTFVVMIDVNDFKGINDTYGHAEGDSALVLVADALRQSIRTHSMPTFLGRYGGDEFILIVHTAAEDELDRLTDEIRDRVRAECRAQEKPYELSVGIGRDELSGDEDTFHRCLQRADHKLYLDKEYGKLHGRGTFLH